jgi:lysophospholipase L1-like esterase
MLSSILNFTLYNRLHYYYSLGYALALDPLGLSHFQKPTPPMDEQLPLVVFFGDSRAAQWINPPINTYQFLNRGIGNQTSAQVANRYDEHIKPLQPDIIILQVGINDMKTIPLFPDRKQEIISLCKDNINQIIDDALMGNAKIILVTIFPVGEIPLERKLVWSDEIEKAVIEVNNYILSISNEDVIIFDVTKILSDADGKIKTEYRVDELHINEDGYQAINLELLSILESLK